MTVEKMREELSAWCGKHASCHDCLLKEAPGCYDSATDEQVEINYKTVFGNTDTEDGASCDMVNSPTHYALPGGMEVIDVEIATQGEEAVKEHCICAAIEYLLRRKKKNGDEDVRKAHWWPSKYIEILEKEAT